MKMNVIPTNAIERKAAVDRMNKMKNKLALGAMSAACTTMMIAGTSLTAFAEDTNEPVTNTAKMDSLLDIVFWVIRIMVLIIGCVAGIPKIVQGQADENPRDRNNGLAVIGIAGAAVGATFAIRGLI